jgi:hypothetical protein
MAQDRRLTQRAPLRRALTTMNLFVSFISIFKEISIGVLIGW